MKKDTVQISDRTCTIYKSEHPEYLLIQPIDEHDLEVLDNEVATIESLTNKSFTLVAFEIKDWQASLPYGQVIRQNYLMVSQLYRHPSGILNGWSMQRTTSPWQPPSISVSVIRKRKRRTPQWLRLATVFANSRNC